MLPRSRWVKLSGSSTSPSASTIEVRMPAPSRGNLRATTPPAPSGDEARAHPFAPALLLLVLEVGAHAVEHRGRLAAAHEAQQERPREAQEGHHHGDRIAGQPEEGLAADPWPKAKGRPGLIARRQKWRLPSASSAALT